MQHKMPRPIVADRSSISGYVLAILERLYDMPLRRCGPRTVRASVGLLSIVLEAPIPKRSFGDKTILYVIYIYIYICIQTSSNLRHSQREGVCFSGLCDSLACELRLMKGSTETMRTDNMCTAAVDVC